RMGFTPWPHDFSVAAQEQTYTLIEANADLILHHMDNGVPWQEALEGAPWPPAVAENIADRVANRRPGQSLYLAITPTALADRSRLADYWAEDEHQPLPVEWAGRALDDPGVVTAYLNYARRMIAAFDPTYFAYGIELTCGYEGPDDLAFEALLRFVAQVYPVLKAEYPALPILLSVCAISLESDDTAALDEANRRLLRYSDYTGLSIYPYLLSEGAPMLTGAADPSRLPSDFLDRYAALDPTKPLAITETGYIAEDLRVGAYGMRITGTPEWQAAYVDLLMRRAHALDAEFVIWFVIRDYDDGVRALEAAGVQEPAFLIWRDTGLFAGNGEARPALAAWRAWLQLPLAP
ncbi:MAG: hypothetical protein ACRC1H_08305, partial [Caldilineaceae bacterium]